MSDRRGKELLFIFEHMLELKLTLREGFWENTQYTLKEFQRK